MDGPNNDFRLYVSGHLAASSIGSITNSPGSSGNAQTSIRLGAQRFFNTQAVFRSVGSESGDMAEAFFMDRLLSEDEIWSKRRICANIRFHLFVSFVLQVFVENCTHELCLEF